MSIGQRTADALADTILDLRTRNAELEELTERLKQEAQIHAQEARTANTTIAEIYQVVSGATGEKGNWNGAEPVRMRIAELEAENAWLKEDVTRVMNYWIYEWLGGDSGSLPAEGYEQEVLNVVAPALNRQLTAMQLYAKGLRDSLEFAAIGSCTCQVKTPDVKYHGSNCRYRSITEALNSAPPDLSEVQGMVFVPIEPTQAMLDAAGGVDGQSDKISRAIYAAMLAAQKEGE